MWAIAIVFGCLLELDSKTLLDTTHFGQGLGQTSQAGTDLETSSLLANFHGTGSCSAGC